MIKVVFFDAAGTLFHVRGSVGEIYLRYAEKYGVQQSPELIAAANKAFKQAFRQAPPPVFAVETPAKLKQCERLWWFDIVHAVFYRIGMFEGFDDYFDEVYRAFAGTEHWVLYPDTYATLETLRNKGLEVGVISNFDTRLFEILRGLGIAPLIDTVTLSSLAGAAKPAPQIFHRALEEHVVDPQECVHVGDSVEEDFAGARQAQLHAVLLDRLNENPDSSTVSIRRLDDLHELIGRLG